MHGNTPRSLNLGPETHMAYMYIHDMIHTIHTRIYQQNKRDLTWFRVSLSLCELQWLSKRALFAAGGCAVSHSSDMNAESLRATDYVAKTFFLIELACTDKTCDTYHRTE